MKSLNQEIIAFKHKGISLSIKREDLLHPEISGNKYRKLKFNLLKARKENQTTLLTFGGAFSNHIAAVAYAGKKFGFKTIGIIRGDELESKATQNPTLATAKENGMQLVYITRTEFKQKDTKSFIEQLHAKYGTFYLIPEGGTNALAITGCEEIITQEEYTFSHLCCAVGTGGTISGIINASKANQTVLGFPSLKGSFLSDDICKFVKKKNWGLIDDYHFGGYGKINEELIYFLNTFFDATGIPLDPVYTGKMMYGIYNLIEKEYFPEGSNILAIHTGGLQGIKGMNTLLEKKKLPLINYL